MVAAAGAAVIEAPWRLGLGWRPATAQLIATRTDIDFVEVIAESIGTATPAALEQLRLGHTPVIPHGIGLSLGSAEGLDPGRLDRLARVCEQLEAPLVSEHIAFVRAGGVEAGHLLPVRRSRAMLDVVVDNVRQAQAVLPVPLALENIATLFEWPEPELTEGQFIAELVARTGAQLLLDLANLYANGRNHGWNVEAFLDDLPLDQVAYCHVAGGIERDGLYYDTHAHPACEEVLALVSEVRARVPAPMLLERDKNFGTRATLENEVEALSAAIARGDARRHRREVSTRVA